MLSLDGVEKIARRKHRVRCEAPDPAGSARQRFLLYRDGPRPADIDNWLLDVELAHAVFKADQVAMWLSELGLPIGFEDVVREHQEFFRSDQPLGEA